MGYFCHFASLTARKIKILKKWKKTLEISSFYICVPKIMIRWCMVPEIWCVTDVIIFHFRLFFPLLPPSFLHALKLGWDFLFSRFGQRGQSGKNCSEIGMLVERGGGGSKSFYHFLSKKFSLLLECSFLSGKYSHLL